MVIDVGVAQRRRDVRRDRCLDAEFYQKPKTHLGFFLLKVMLHVTVSDKPSHA